MIRIQCANCRTVLEMDDAFAGGTCRCRHCGTIQTVPGNAPRAHRAAAPTATGGQPTPAGSRTLYAEQQRGRAAPGTGLDELADVVASSGGLSSAAGRRIREGISGASVPPESGGALNPPGDSSMRSRATLMLVVVGAIGGIALGAILTAVIASRPSPTPAVVPGAASPSGEAVSGAAPAAATPPASADGARFLSVPLNEPSVVFVLDRGASARESLGYMIAASMKAARLMGRDRRFQVIFWDNGQDVVAHPSAGPAFATPEAVAATERAIEGVVAFGRSDAAPAVRRAAAANPGAIVLVTAKAFELDDAFVESVLLARGQSPAKVHVISVGASGGHEALERLARASGGQFAAVSVGELKAFGREPRD